MRSVMIIPIASPPITPPAIAPTIMRVGTDALLLSALAIEVFSAGEALVSVVASSTPRETIGPVVILEPLMVVV